MMDTSEAIFTRRSVRQFTGQPIPAEVLSQVLQAGAAAPSGGNLQARNFILVQTGQNLAGLRSLAPGIIGEPQAIIVICLDNRRAAQLGGSGSERHAWMDVGIAVQNILLAAHSQGLGACPIGSFHREAVAAYLDVPAGAQPVLLVALGYAAKPPASPGRRPLAEVCFSEKWEGVYEQ
jgi:nitroreductase